MSKRKNNNNNSRDDKRERKDFGFFGFQISDFEPNIGYYSKKNKKNI